MRDHSRLNRYGGQAGVGEQLDVFGVAVVAVAGVAGQLHAGHQLLACPPVAVDVVAFDLVPGRSRAPQEVLGESGHLRSFRVDGVHVMVAAASVSAPVSGRRRDAAGCGVRGTRRVRRPLSVPSGNTMRADVAAGSSAGDVDLAVLDAPLDADGSLRGLV